MFIRPTLSFSLMAWMAVGVCQADEASDAVPEVRRLEKDELLDEGKLVRVDAALPGVSDYAEKTYVGVGDLNRMDLSVVMQPEVRAKKMVFWIGVTGEGRAYFRLWRDRDRTEEIYPHLEGSRLPHDVFGIDSLPQAIWIESNGVSGGSISIHCEERPAPVEAK